MIVPSVPSGKYYLRVEPEMAPGSPFVGYDLRLRRDVPNYGFFGLAALLLLIPPVLTTFRRGSFEAARWRESDYAPIKQSSSGEVTIEYSILRDLRRAAAGLTGFAEYQGWSW